MNDENLKKGIKFGTDEEATRTRTRACAREGGIKSGEVRRKKREFREAIEAVLEMSTHKGKRVSIEELQTLADANGKNLSVQDAILAAIAKNAMRGDIQSAEFLRDTVGEKPTEKVMVAEVDQNIVDEVEAIVMETAGE